MTGFRLTITALQRHHNHPGGCLAGPIEPALLTYDGGEIRATSRGEDFETLKKKLTEHDRAFIYLRIQAGDEMSKRSKFVFITWLSETVGVLQRARISSDKAAVKEIIKNFAVELQVGDPGELTEDHIKNTVSKAGGTDYGTAS
ncbi:coactosin-like protein isoform X1 [Dermacentor andersoni]|uniref:coactosin-like protein isoform X1 n=1 Tax=Dermacentor andersoni TaxID=34620 RepID=UPI002417CB86|nr:coactosin-like protein isoform X1 [Dermacentor andersoni]